MRLLLFILFSFIFLTDVDASNLLYKIKIGSNAKTSKLEIRLNSAHKKNLQANVIIINAEGKEVNAFKCEIINGLNAVCMQEALNLEEGIYTVKMRVKKKTSSTKFVLFK